MSHTAALRKEDIAAPTQECQLPCTIGETVRLPFTLSTKDAIKFAELVGDPNPFHRIHEEAVLWATKNKKHLPLPGAVVAPGMFTIGVGSGRIVHWLGIGTTVIAGAFKLRNPIYTEEVVVL